ncbi:MAG: type II toxin-antitoxin system RelE/ParE family toxin [Sphingomonas sp.]
MQVAIGEAAGRDLGRIYDFNLGRSVAWADSVERRLPDRASALASNALLGRPITKDGLRRLSVTDIQYVIDYRIAEEVIEILRFQSTREGH